MGLTYGAVALGIGAIEAGLLSGRILLDDVHARLRVPHLNVVGRNDTLGMVRGRVLAARIGLSWKDVGIALAADEWLDVLGITAGLDDVVVSATDLRGRVVVAYADWRGECFLSLSPVALLPG